jgi:hypothetical protein
MDNQKILDNVPPKQGKWPDCNQIDSDGKWSHRQPLIRSLADIQRLAEHEKEAVIAMKQHHDLCWNIADLEKERDEKIIERLKEDALVMANARRLIKANVRTSNGRLYSEIFGTGCGSGRLASKKLGLDPDGNKTCYSTMCSYIDKALKVGV